MQPWQQLKQELLQTFIHSICLSWVAKQPNSRLDCVQSGPGLCCPGILHLCQHTSSINRLVTSIHIPLPLYECRQFT